MSISDDNKAIAQHLKVAFGGEVRVTAYNHDTLPHLSIDLLHCPDRPTRGVTSYSTIGLSDRHLLGDQGAFPARLELCGAAASTTTRFPNIIATASFIIARGERVTPPGTILEGVVREYYPDSGLPHLYLTPPFLWEPALTRARFGPKDVLWLIAMPVSEDERQFCVRRGSEALENLFTEQQIDIFDIDRNTVV